MRRLSVSSRAFSGYVYLLRLVHSKNNVFKHVLAWLRPPEKSFQVVHVRLSICLSVRLYFRMSVRLSQVGSDNFDVSLLQACCPQGFTSAL